ncbi:lysophospholipid acyltransferase family protein [Patescibacteria group bacterium]
MKKIIRLAVYEFFRKSIDSLNGLDNLPAEGPYLIAANHNDYLDGFRITAAFHPHRDDYIYFLAKTNNYWWTRVVIQIDWQDKIKTLSRVVKMLNRGRIICNFPEGRRNLTDRLLPGKTGTVRMAIKAQVPIVPLGIVGHGDSSYLDSVRSWIGNNKKYSINVGKPIEYIKYFDQELEADLINKLTQEMMKNIAKLCDKKVD